MPKSVPEKHITQKWDPTTLHFIDWPTKHTQTELAKSIRLWESISSINWAHTVKCKHRSYSYHSLVLEFSELNFPRLADQAEKALTEYYSLMNETCIGPTV